jgi:hypothetical protein
MDDRQFDDMTRTVGMQTDRRGLLNAAAGGVLGLGGALGTGGPGVGQEMQKGQRLFVEPALSQQEVRRV